MNQLIILCPLPLELEALLLRMSERGHVSYESMAGPLKVYDFPNLGWRFSLAGHGKTQFGIQNQFQYLMLWQQKRQLNMIID